MAVVYSKVLLFDPPLIYTAPDTCVFGEASGSGHVQDAPGAGRGGEDGERVCDHTPGGIGAAYRHAREGLQRAALHQKHDYDGKVQRGEWIHDITLGRNREAKLQILITKGLDRGRVVVRRKQV